MSNEFSSNGNASASALINETLTPFAMALKGATLSDSGDKSTPTASAPPFRNRRMIRPHALTNLKNLAAGPTIEIGEGLDNRLPLVPESLVCREEFR